MIRNIAIVEMVSRLDAESVDREYIFALSLTDSNDPDSLEWLSEVSARKASLIREKGNG